MGWLSFRPNTWSLAEVAIHSQTVLYRMIENELTNLHLLTVLQ